MKHADMRRITAWLFQKFLSELILLLVLARHAPFNITHVFQIVLRFVAVFHPLLRTLRRLTLEQYLRATWKHRMLTTIGEFEAAAALVVLLRRVALTIRNNPRTDDALGNFRIEHGVGLRARLFR